MGKQWSSGGEDAIGHAYHGRLPQRLVDIGTLPAVVDDEESGGRAPRNQAPQALVQPCAMHSGRQIQLVRRARPSKVVEAG